uniref:dihydrofolate reductase n=1 Tax=viral metagenome TaxID=1070528 RepID=A0A6C0HIJ6_9ZZZZ
MELIVAFAKNGVIGNNNEIPWHVPEDLIRFKHMTLGQVIVMGRKTFESLPNGPLKNRVHIVLTRAPVISSNTNVVFVNTENLKQTLEQYHKTHKIFVIGGREIYDLLIDYCEVIHITLIDIEPEGDVIFSYDIKYFLRNYMLFYESNLFESTNGGVPYKYYTFYKK